jgi:hypothetical protein
MNFNVLSIDTRPNPLKDMRDLTTTQYAIYDFGYSLMYPYETILEDVTETRFLNFEMRGPGEMWMPADVTYGPFAIPMMGRVSLARFMALSNGFRIDM